MPKMIIEISPELLSRVQDWGLHFKCKPERLAVELLEEYFDDCDDADKLEALIQSGKMATYPASIVHHELSRVEG